MNITHTHTYTHNLLLTLCIKALLTSDDANITTRSKVAVPPCNASACECYNITTTFNMSDSESKMKAPTRVKP